MILLWFIYHYHVLLIFDSIYCFLIVLAWGERDGGVMGGAEHMMVQCVNYIVSSGDNSCELA